MADEDVDEESKTEDPSPRRREEARKRGSVPFSTELVGAAVLLAAVVGLMSFGRSIGDGVLDIVRTELVRAAQREITPAAVQERFTRLAVRAVAVLAPWFGVMVAAGVAAGVAQAGFQITPERLELKPEKLNPAEGAKRLFSTAALVKGGLAVLKVLAIGGVAYWVLESRAGVIWGLGRESVDGAVRSAWAVALRLALYLSAGTAVIAALDYVYQRRRFEVSLRMTKQEVKEELKQDEGDPHLKARIRQIARERSRRKMMAEVPKATVVLTNPTHYAVALRYRQGTDAAPVLVAKGAGPVALRIAKLARDRGVPVLERPPLARAIYAGVKEGKPIPDALFRAAAEVIAFVFKLRGIGPHPNE
jgi:flagellar biosynthetic protein FlhB